MEPQLATLVDAAPEGDDWFHEIKLDGYRIQARLDRGKVKLLTRRGHDWSAKMPSVVGALAQLSIGRAVFDGELVVMKDGGISSFQRLQNSLPEGHDGDCTPDCPRYSELINSRGLQDWVVDEEAVPGASTRTGAELRYAIRQYSEADFHPVGTCRMGGDHHAVVDPKLRVRGVRGLKGWRAPQSCQPSHPETPVLLYDDRRSLRSSDLADARVICSRT